MLNVYLLLGVDTDIDVDVDVDGHGHGCVSFYMDLLYDL
jgi:hypothetical protein